jgi:hypothetical protein
MKQIDENEKEAIEKLPQRAKQLRHQFFQLTTTHTNQILQKLEPLSGQLIDGQTYDAFIEIDLPRWKQS